MGREFTGAIHRDRALGYKTGEKNREWVCRGKQKRAQESLNILEVKEAQSKLCFIEISLLAVGAGIGEGGY